jgi:hypothetical protein
MDFAPHILYLAVVHDFMADAASKVVVALILISGYRRNFLLGRVIIFPHFLPYQCHGRIVLS